MPRHAKLMSFKQRRIEGDTLTAVQDVLFQNLKKTILECMATGASLVLCMPGANPQLHSLPEKTVVSIHGNVRVVKLSKDVTDALANKEVVLSSKVALEAVNSSDEDDNFEGGVQFQKIVDSDPLGQPLTKVDGSESCLCTHCRTVFSRSCPLFKKPKKKPQGPTRCVTRRREGKLYPSERKRLQKAPCEYCGKVISFGNLKYHLEMYHPEQYFNGDKDRPSVLKRSQKVPCKYCGKLIGGRSLRYHLESHEGKTHQCRHCDKNFATPFSRTVHEKIHTRGSSGEHACSHCPKRFYSSPALKVHLNMTHGGMKRYFCDLCSKGFYFANQLKIHRRIHTGERPHVCDICGRGFVRTYALKQHVAKQHSCGPAKVKDEATKHKETAGSQ